MPNGSPPANASPDSFSITRFHLSGLCGFGDGEAAVRVDSWAVSRWSCTAAASFVRWVDRAGGSSLALLPQLTGSVPLTARPSW
ncbi:hypothetical protein GCM10020216_025150 [Nonomuraea helvata]